MHVLIVGAGAAGLTYGHAFARAGAKVSFLIKPHHRAGLENGVTMLRHSVLLPGLRAEQFTDFSLIDEIETADLSQIDQVWNTVPSDALGESWLTALRDRLAPQTVIVGLQPGPKDDARMAAIFGPERLVKGVIGFLAYQYPLPGRTDKKGRSGIAFLIPPSAGGLGPSDRIEVQQARELLKQGGLPVSLSDTLREDYLTVSALSLTHMAGLEVAGWSFKAFRAGTGDSRRLARGAAFEALTITDQALGRAGRGKLNRRLSGLGPLISRIAGLVPSLPLETYLGFHFSKVGAQTRTVLTDLIAMGRDANLPTSDLQSLLHKLEALDAETR